VNSKYKLNELIRELRKDPIISLITRPGTIATKVTILKIMQY